MFGRSLNPGPTVRDLRALSDDDLDIVYKQVVEMYSGLIPPEVMIAFVLEYGRRDTAQTNRTLMRINWSMAIMTAAVTIMTLIILVITVSGH